MQALTIQQIGLVQVTLHLTILLSGDFKKGVPLGKVTVFAGESGAGKSYIVAGNIVKYAQEQGIFVVLIDTENALDETWLQRIRSRHKHEAKLLKLNMAMIDDVAKTISQRLWKTIKAWTKKTVLRYCL